MGVKLFKWIPVDESKPREMIDLVLVCRNEGAKATLPARYVDGEFFVCDGFSGLAKLTFIGPTHWMPLPDPPSGPDDD